MKHILITTIAAVLLVGCGESQQSAPPAEAKPVEPVAEASQPEPPTAKAPDISIQEAVESGNIEVVKQHIAAGVDVNAKEEFTGDTLLRYAARKGHKEIVELLIAEGADVNAKESAGWTPLHNAALDGHREIAELLIAEGADVNAKHVGGQTPLDLAKGETADILRKHGGKTGAWFDADKSIHKAASAGHIEAVKQHLAAGTDLNAKNKYGSTPLHYAANKEIAELLIAEDANVNEKDDNGSTPLHFAAVNGPKVIVELLIANGADVNAKDEDGGTPLDVAISFNRTEIADLLRKHGGKTGEELKAAGN
jgi:ankyrin repeat protein